jgi:predicted CopG family antitoxin
MKNIKIRDETWQSLMQLKIQFKKKSIDETLKALLLKMATIQNFKPQIEEMERNIGEARKILRGEKVE